jgi:hypothetical protein
MEVKGYADAAKWVYGHALDPGPWESADLLTAQEVRSIVPFTIPPCLRSGTSLPTRMRPPKKGQVIGGDMRLSRSPEG